MALTSFNIEHEQGLLLLLIDWFANAIDCRFEKPVDDGIGWSHQHQPIERLHPVGHSKHHFFIFFASIANTAPARATVIALSSKYFDMLEFVNQKLTFVLFLLFYVFVVHAFLYIFHRVMLHWFTAGFTAEMTDRSFHLITSGQRKIGDVIAQELYFRITMKLVSFELNFEVTEKFSSHSWNAGIQYSHSKFTVFE